MTIFQNVLYFVLYILLILFIGIMRKDRFLGFIQRFFASYTLFIILGVVYHKFTGNSIFEYEHLTLMVYWTYIILSLILAFLFWTTKMFYYEFKDDVKLYKRIKINMKMIFMCIPVLVTTIMIKMMIFQGGHEQAESFAARMTLWVYEELEGGDVPNDN